LFCSASIVKDVARYCETNLSSALAYFFFDGRDGQKNLQQVDGLIRSLIRQFSATYGGVPSVLTKLYHACHDGGSPPSIESLCATLLLILEAFDEVFIILDALDECVERKELLKWIKDMTSWRKGKLHLLGTSRQVEDIAKYLRSLDPDHVCMVEDFITYDIEKYIDSILHQDDAFEHWDSEVKETIKNKLLENAGGMYVGANLKKVIRV
jgi:NACHT domain